jgi:predicted neuraminidase
VDERFDGVVRADAAGSPLGEALLPTIHPGDSHAANLVELPGGDVLCTWFNGPGEGDPQTNIVLSRLDKGSGVWSAPRLLSSDTARSEQNPVVWAAPSGAVWLLHTSNEPHDQSTARVLRRISDDGGTTWAAATTLFAEPGTFLRSPPLRLSNGEWLLPIYHCRRGAEYSAVKRSADGGASWQEHPVPDSAGRVQLTVAEVQPGQLLGLFRSRDADRIYQSRSTDFGRTWTVPTRTALPNNNSSIQLTGLSGGQLALVFNDVSADRDQIRWVRAGDGLRRKAVRTPLTLAISTDGGQTWPFWRNLQMADEEYLDNELGYSYPSIIQTGDGDLQVAFSYLRKTIKHIRVGLDWAMTGER